MSRVATKLLLPLYLLMCLVLGGSNQGVWFPAILQTTAVLLIGFVALSVPGGGLPGSSRLLLCMIGAALLLATLQLVPLSPQMWTQLPGRLPIKDGYETLGLALPWLPLSLTPHETLQAAFFALPFLAVLLGLLLAREIDLRWVVAALVLGTIASVGLGAMQAAGGESWKIYSITNTGAVGFFANRNFFGTLLVINIPFAVALIGSRQANKHAGMTFSVIGAAYLLLILIGIVLNRSLAAISIVAPVSVASLALLPFRLSWKWYAAVLGILLVIAAIILLTNNPIQQEIIGTDTVSIQTRVAIWSKTLRVLGDTFPVGTGLGSFREIYDFYEDPALVDHWYVNNAHNDYLELVLELGLPGVLLILGFLFWWVVQATRVWGSPHVGLIPRAATIASAAILAHSTVDYPLRTAAISAIFGFCLGAIATAGWSSARSAHPTERHMRHVRIG